LDRTTKIVFLLLGIAFLFIYIRENVVDLSLRASKGESSVDFRTFYYVAKGALQGLGIYDQGSLQQLVIKELKIGAYPFLYHPFSVIIFIPLTLFKYFIAQNIWLAIKHISIPIILVLGYSSIKLFRENRISYVVIATLCLLLFYPLRFELLCGQVNVLVLLMLMAMYVCYKRKRYMLCSICLALGIVLKQMPVIFLVFFLLLHERKIFIYTVMIVACMTIIVIPLFGLETLRSYTALIVSSGYVQKLPSLPYSAAVPISYSLNCLFIRLFVPNEFMKPVFDNPMLGKIFCYLSCLTLLSFALLSHKKNIVAREDVIDIKFNLLLITMILISPLGWEHYLVFVFFPCVYLFVAIVESISKKNISFIILSFIALLFIMLKPLDENAFFSSGICVFIVSFKFYGVLLLWGLLYYLEHEGDRQLSRERLSG